MILVLLLPLFILLTVFDLVPNTVYFLLAFISHTNCAMPLWGICKMG